jgi:hypothetical protein
MNIHASLLAAAASGILLGAAGCASHTAEAPASEMPAASSGAVAAEPHACKGMNSCKGQGACKTDKNGWKGQNECKGQGGCKTS